MFLTRKQYRALEKKGGYAATEPYRAVLCERCNHRRGQHSSWDNGKGEYIGNWNCGWDRNGVACKCKEFVENEFLELVNEMREMEGKMK